MSNHELIRLKNLFRANQLNYVISYFFQLHLMLHACVQRFDVMGTVEIFFETKHGLRFLERRVKSTTTKSDGC